MKDLFGKAILDFQTHNSPENIITETSISDADEMSVSYLFRDFDAMPVIEKTALLLAKGRVLDVGCGAGSHSLYLQNARKLETCAIDISANAIKTCQLRQIKNSFKKDIFEITLEDFGLFDTILLLMNGTGICGKMNRLDVFLQQLKSLLAIDGQILIDSSDIAYMFEDDEQSTHILNDDEHYYGELIFEISYKNEKEEPFDWLFLDFYALQKACLKNGLICEKIIEGENHDYLARISETKKP